MSSKRNIETYGENGSLIVPADTPFYRPSADATTPERQGASVSYRMEMTLEAARAALDRHRNGEDGERFDDWYVVRFEPCVRITIVQEGDER